MKQERRIHGLLETIMVIVFAGITTFLFLLKSPLHPWISSTAGTDSSVFKTVAMVIQNGDMPYRDTFDHKGPLLYIINCLGNLISTYKGVWVIEFFSLLITLVMMYRIARLVCKRSSSVVVTLVAFSLMFTYFQGGNLTEEYALPFITISSYFFLDYFLNGKTNNVRKFVCGLCFGAVLLIRANMISVWIAMYIAIFSKTVKEKDWKILRQFIIWSVAGVLLIVLPFLFWLGINNAFEQFWNDYILFNISYSSAEGGRALFPAKWNAFFTFFNTIVFVISIFSLLYCKDGNRKFINWFYLLYLLLSLFFIAMSGMVYLHYGMVLVPAVVYPMSLLYANIEDTGLPKLEQVLSAIVSLYLLCTIIVPNWVELTQDLPKKYEEKQESHIDWVVDTVADYIKANTTAEEQISVYGNWDIIYVISNRLHATNYSYTYPIGEVRPQIMDEYFSQLKQELPPIIVIQKGQYDNRIANFLADNQYQLIWSENSNLSNGAIIFSRK